MFAILWMVTGGCIYSFAVGNLASVMTNMDTRDTQLKEKQNAVNQFSKEAHLTKILREKLKKAIAYVTKRNFVWADKKEIF